MKMKGNKHETNMGKNSMFVDGGRTPKASPKSRMVKSSGSGKTRKGDQTPNAMGLSRG